MTTPNATPEMNAVVKHQYVRPEVRRVRLDPAQTVLESCHVSLGAPSAGACKVPACAQVGG